LVFIQPPFAVEAYSLFISLIRSSLFPSLPVPSVSLAYPLFLSIMPNSSATSPIASLKTSLMISSHEIDFSACDSPPMGSDVYRRIDLGTCLEYPEFT